LSAQEKRTPCSRFRALCTRSQPPANPSAAMPTAPQFDDHVSWLRSLRAQYDNEVVNVERTSSCCPVGFGSLSFESPASSPRSHTSAVSPSRTTAAVGALPEVAMTWAHQDELNEDAFGYGFGSLSLDDSALDEPIYRSMGSIMASAEFVDDPLYVDDEPPVTRGFSSALAAATFDDSLDEESESKWLQTMPPLIRRQKAGNIAAPMTLAH